MWGQGGHLFDGPLLQAVRRDGASSSIAFIIFSNHKQTMAERPR